MSRQYRLAATFFFPFFISFFPFCSDPPEKGKEGQSVSDWPTRDHKANELEASRGRRTELPTYRLLMDFVLVGSGVVACRPRQGVSQSSLQCGLRNNGCSTWKERTMIEARGEVSDFYCHMHQITKTHSHVLLFLVAPPSAVMSLDTSVDNPGDILSG